MSKFGVFKIIGVFAAILILLLGIVILGGDVDDYCVARDSASSEHGLVKPMKSHESRITRTFGEGENSFSYGVDFAAEEGTPIYAFAKGTVIAVQRTGVPAYGGWIVISHRIDDKEYSTVYGHVGPGGVFVKEGDSVYAGQRIATLSNNGESTGTHLHFELIEGNRLAGGTPIDPQPWLSKAVEPESAAARGLSGKKSQSNATEIQRERAQQIIRTGHSMHIPQKGIVLAVAVAKVESQVNNLASSAVPESLNYPHDGVAPGDADSVGLFQQRPSQGWGTVGQLMDPVYASSKFYAALQRVPNWEKMGFAEAAWAVQRCREDLAGRYEEERPFAEAVVSEVDDNSHLSSQEMDKLGDVAAGKTSGDDGCLNLPGGGAAGALNEAIIRYAKEQEGLPYVWGGGDFHGATGGGFDCSGLVLYSIYQASHGRVRLLHQTNSQIIDPHFEKVSWEDRQPGDILYFGSPADWHHTSIYLGKIDGQEMQFEAQDFNVPIGAYPVRFGEQIQVRRVKDIPPTQSEDER